MLTHCLVNPGRSGHKDCHIHIPELKLKWKLKYYDHMSEFGDSYIESALTVKIHYKCTIQECINYWFYKAPLNVCIVCSAGLQPC